MAGKPAGASRADASAPTVAGRFGVVALSLAAGAMLLAFSAWAVIFDRAQTIADAEHATANLAQAYAGHAERSLGEIERILDNLNRTLVYDKVDAANAYALHLLLIERIATAPQFSAVVIIDRDGKIIASSLNYPERKVDVSDRPYFAYHRDDPDLGMLVGDVLRSRLTGRPLISLTERIPSEDGSFRGVVSAGLLTDYLTQFYSTADLGPDAVVEIVNARGNVIARWPNDDGALGSPSPDWERLAALATGAARSIRWQSASGAIDRIHAAQVVPRRALFLHVAIGTHHALRGWREEVIDHSIAVGLACAALAVLTAVFLRQRRRLEASEADARRHGEILRQVIASMGDAVAVADRQGRIIVWNPAAEALLGAGGLNAPADRWPRVSGLLLPEGTTPFPPDRLPLRRALAGESTDDVEMIVAGTGSAPSRTIVVSGRPITDDRRQVTGGVIVARDVTARRELERRLQQAQRLETVGQLTGGIAHDFNNLLTVILGNADALAEDLPAQARSRRMADAIRRAAERGAELTRRLLAFARRQPLQPGQIDVNALVVETGALLRRTLGEKVGIQSLLQPDLWPATADPGQLQTALLNIALNARDAMPDGGTLTVETKNVVLDDSYAASRQEVLPGEYVMIALSDTGTGIPAAIRDKVFEPFFTTKDVGKGSGLGLSMVYGFVKQSGGHVGLYSEEGMGTTIRLYLPRGRDEAISAAEGARAGALARGSETILVVEDEPNVRTFVVDQLRDLGYRIVEAEAAAQALGILGRDHGIELLFTDVVMPGGMSGLALAREARTMRPPLKVLLTSGYSESALAGELSRDPNIRLLTKPYRVVDLARMVRAALDGA